MFFRVIVIHRRCDDWGGAPEVLALKGSCRYADGSVQSAPCWVLRRMSRRNNSDTRRRIQRKPTPENTQGLVAAERLPHGERNELLAEARVADRRVPALNHRNDRGPDTGRRYQAQAPGNALESRARFRAVPFSRARGSCGKYLQRAGGGGREGGATGDGSETEAGVLYFMMSIRRFDCPLCSRLLMPSDLLERAHIHDDPHQAREPTYDSRAETASWASRQWHPSAWLSSDHQLRTEKL